MVTGDGVGRIMKALNKDSLMARILGWVAAAVLRHPRWFVWPQILIFGLCVAFTVFHLKLDMDNDHLVGPNQRYHANHLAMLKEFPEPDRLVVAVESDNPDKNRQFVERIAARMQAETNLFRDVFYQQNLSVMREKTLLYASDQDLVEMQNTLRVAQPFIRQFTQTTNLVSLFEQINTTFRTAPQEETTETKSLVKSLPSLTRIVSQADQAMQRSGVPPSPNVTTLLSGDEDALLASYLTFARGRLFLVTTHSPNDDLTGDAIERLRVLVQQTEAEVPGVNVGLTGEPVLDYDTMMQAQKDTTLASMVSLVLCALIFIYGYNETGRPIKATLCLVIGLGYTMGFTTLVIGHLNILTITFVPMLIGLAIDFGVNLITRYEEELRHGRTEAEALTKAMVFTGQGIFTGALTTAGAFGAMAFTNFKGIQEMGIICGGGLMLCLIPMLTMLPALLLRGRQNVLDHQVHEDETRARIENIWLQRPWLVAGLTASLCVAALIAGRKLYFDYNLLKMQNPRLPSVVYAEKLMNSADKSLLYAAVITDSLTNAVALQQQIEKLPLVAGTEPEFYKDFLNTNQSGKLKLIGQIKEQVAALDFAPPDPRPVDIYALSRTLYALSGYLGNALEAVGTNDAELTAQLVTLREAIGNLRKTALQGDATDFTDHADKLARFQQALFADLQDTFHLLQHQDNSAPLQVNDLPPALKNQFIGVSGKFLIQIYPKEDVWERAPQERFIAALRAIDPDVTGTPVQLYEYESLLKNSYVQASWYSLAAIALMVLIHFRSLTAVILALLPVGIGTLWLVGLMGWLKMPVNLSNIMTLPLVIGIGVTNGIHILNRYAEEGTPGILSRSTGKAVLVSGLTAIAGFGSLILAQHNGIHSLGVIMSVGIAMCMLAGLTFLPAFLNLIGRWRPLIDNKKPDADDSSTPGSGGTEVKNLN